VNSCRLRVRGLQLAQGKKAKKRVRRGRVLKRESLVGKKRSKRMTKKSQGGESEGGTSDGLERPSKGPGDG